MTILIALSSVLYPKLKDTNSFQYIASLGRRGYVFFGVPSISRSSSTSAVVAAAESLEDAPAISDKRLVQTAIKHGVYHRIQHGIEICKTTDGDPYHVGIAMVSRWARYHYGEDVVRSPADQSSDHNQTTWWKREKNAPQILARHW